MLKRLTGELHATLLGNHSLWPRTDGGRQRSHESRQTVGGTSAALVPPTRYVEADSREAQASLGATSSSASPRWISPLATGVTAPNFFLFVTTTGVMVS